MNNSVANNNDLRELDVCLAMEDVITESCVIGCQKISKFVEVVYKYRPVKNLSTTEWLKHL